MSYEDVIPYDPDVHPRDPKKYPYGRVNDHESFILKAKWIHGSDRFDYSETEFVSSQKKVKITCHRTEKHDKPHTFETTPNSHITKRAICPKCSGKYRWTTEEWIEEATKKWDGAFDYSEVEYKGAFTKIWVTHKQCGNRFSVTADNHMRGKGCPKCKKTSPRRFESTEKYIEELVKVHGHDAYDTSRVKIKTQKDKIQLKCNLHDVWFETYPHALIDKKSKGCPVCSSSYKTREVWIDQAIKRHSDKDYDYSKVEENPVGKQEIYCKKHNHIFYLAYSSHVRFGTKCRFCAAEENVGGYKLGDLGGHSPDDPATMYHVRITNKETGHSFFKVGVTKQKSTNARFCSGSFKQFYEVEVLNEYKSTLLEVLEQENTLIGKIDETGKRFLEHELKGSYIGGWTECYRSCDEDVREMVEEFFMGLE